MSGPRTMVGLLEDLVREREADGLPVHPVEQSAYLMGLAQGLLEPTWQELTHEQRGALAREAIEYVEVLVREERAAEAMAAGIVSREGAKEAKT